MNLIPVKIGIIVFFLIYSVFMFSLFNFRKRIDMHYYKPFLLGGAAFLSIFIIQIPLQRLLVNSLFWNVWSDTLKAFLYASIAGFVQEFFKVLVVFFRKDKILSGASAGAGFGFIEATLLLSSVTSFSVIAIVERLFSIIFHISSTSLIMYGATRKKFFLYYLIISLVHTGVDTIAVMYQMHKIALTPTEIFVAAIASMLFIISICLYKKRLRTTII